MEDAVDALKMAFSVFAFILALAIVFGMFSQARAVSDIVIARTDNTYFAEYEFPDGMDKGRTVGIETVIPTLYRYYKEKFAVDIKSGNTIQEKFDENIERYVYMGNDKSNEYKWLYENGTPWLGEPNVDISKRVSLYISGTVDKIIGTKLTKYGETNLKKLRNSNFIETFTQTNEGAKKYNGEDGSVIYLIPGTTKLYITYAVQ